MRDAKMRSETPYMLFGVMFTVIAVIALIGIVMLNSRADTTGQTATVDNVQPIVDTIVIATTSGGTAASSLTLDEATTETYYVHGTAHDNNGCDEIDSIGGGANADWTLMFYRTNLAAGAACEPDNLNCYEMNAPSLSGCTVNSNDTTIAYEFTMDIHNFADATDAGSSPDYSATNWTAAVAIDDERTGGGPSDPLSATTEINTLKSLNVTSSITYTSMALGATSDQQTIVVTNTGNDNTLDPLIRATDWSCGSGTSMDSQQQRWHLTNATAYGSMNALTNLDNDIDSVGSLAKQTVAGTPSTQNVYTRLQLPTTGVAGTCTNTITFTAN